MARPDKEAQQQNDAERKQSEEQVRRKPAEREPSDEAARQVPRITPLRRELDESGGH